MAGCRSEELSVGPAEWANAPEGWIWARQLRGSGRLRAKQLTAAAHVKRFEAQAARGSTATLLSQESLDIFKEAARADPESFDPWLGMARLEIYALGDVDAGARSLAEAEKLGYVPGRREAAMLGDGYLRRATASRTRAAVLTGEQRMRELTKARDDYQRCITYFDPIVAFGHAAQNLEICKAQLQRIDRQIEQELFGS
jgi:hypothetical protein